jgi:hypothetical protein
MGLDANNSAAAIAATLAASLNYSQQQGSLGYGGQSQSRPRPPALARVSCQICRKELCNKYFLKSHLLNAHHITADDFMMNQMLNASANENNEQMQQQQQATTSTGDKKSLADQFDSKKLNSYNNNNNNNGTDTSPSNNASQMLKKLAKKSSDDSNDENENDANDEELEEGQQMAAMMVAKQNLMSFNALLNYNKMLNPSGEASAESSSAEGSNLFGNNCNMQPFLFECQDDSEFNSNFVPCMVYLPVKSKLSTSVTLRVALKPLDSATIASTAGKAVETSKTTNDEEEAVEEN